MAGLNIQTENDQIIIQLSKDCFDENYILNLLERINIEYLAKKANFNDKVFDVAKEINEKWWMENKDAFLKDVVK